MVHLVFHDDHTQIPKVAETCLRNIVDKNCGSADNWCMLLSNLSRPEHLAERLFAEIKDGMDGLFAAFIQLNYNTADCHLSHLGNRAVSAWRGCRAFPSGFLACIPLGGHTNMIMLLRQLIFSLIYISIRAEQFFASDRGPSIPERRASAKLSSAIYYLHE